MHFEVLVEDRSGEEMLSRLFPKIVGGCSYRCHAYHGKGSLPDGNPQKKKSKDRSLLGQLPVTLRGFESAWQSGAQDMAMIIVCDLDDDDRKKLTDAVNALILTNAPSLQVCFCLAIEEGEAWLLGDRQAVRSAYPNATKISRLKEYQQDSICGTWELLADALYPSGHSALEKQGYCAVGEQKIKWAQQIAPWMDVGRNKSPSFCFFRDELRRLAAL